MIFSQRCDLFTNRTSFSLNHIFFSANENGTVKQNNQSDFKAFLNSPITLQENKRQKSNCLANLATWSIDIGLFYGCSFCSLFVIFLSSTIDNVLVHSIQYEFFYISKLHSYSVVFSKGDPGQALFSLRDNHRHIHNGSQ